MSESPAWNVVWITGASGGIGRELALQLAARGMSVAATARSEDKLQALANESDRISVFAADVTDAGALSSCAEAIEKRLGPIDLAIMGAGTFAPFDPVTLDVGGFRRTAEVNYLGAVHAIAAALPSMISRQQGHIAIIGSIMGYFSLPEGGGYAATKAALINLAQSLKLELEPHGIDITIINLGFTRTGMNAHYEGRLPFEMGPRKAARRIIEGLLKGGFEIAFPRRIVWFLKVLRCLPYPLSFWIIRTFVMSNRRRMGDGDRGRHDLQEGESKGEDDDAELKPRSSRPR